MPLLFFISLCQRAAKLPQQVRRMRLALSSGHADTDLVSPVKAGKFGEPGCQLGSQKAQLGRTCRIPAADDDPRSSDVHDLAVTLQGFRQQGAQLSRPGLLIGCLV